jgi:hypothetical protein
VAGYQQMEWTNAICSWKQRISIFPVTVAATTIITTFAAKPNQTIDLDFNKNNGSQENTDVMSI